MKRVRGFPALAVCAPIDGEKPADRRMRLAVSRAKRLPGFSEQQAFDRAIARLVKATPVPAEIEEWFANEKLAEGSRRNWRTTARHPAILAIAIAVAVIAFVAWLKFDEQMHAFPGASIANKLLTVASVTHYSQFEPVQAEAGALGDLFLMKYRLSHYDVPPEFSHLRTIGVRVFDEEEAGKVAQIATSEKRMHFFLFPAPRDPSTGQPEEFQHWRYVEQEGWTGAVHQSNGVCFMAVLRGDKKEFAPYLRRGSAR